VPAIPPGIHFQERLPREVVDLFGRYCRLLGGKLPPTRILNIRKDTAVNSRRRYSGTMAVGFANINNEHRNYEMIQLQNGNIQHHEKIHISSPTLINEAP
jgi:hypothetical protein